jgi:hypothetical protein
MTLAQLGYVYAMIGELTRAAELLPQVLQMQQAMKATMALGWTHLYLGILALFQGNGDKAAQEFLQSLDSAPQGGAQFIAPYALEGLAGVLALRQQPEPGARLLGTAEALRQTLDYPHSPIDAAFFNKILTGIEVQVGADGFQKAWQRGHQLTAAQALAEAKASLHGSEAG